MKRLVPDLDSFTSKIPMGRLGTTRDIAEATVYLFSPAASYVTGTVQIVDGGAWHTGNNSTSHLYPVKLVELNTQKLISYKHISL